MTQEQQVLHLLRTKEWVSTVDFVNRIFCLRGGARIYDLRKKGYQIESRKVEGKSYEEYRLITEPHQILEEVKEVIPPAKVEAGTQPLFR